MRAQHWQERTCVIVRYKGRDPLHERVTAGTGMLDWSWRDRKVGEVKSGERWEAGAEKSGMDPWFAL